MRLRSVKFKQHANGFEQLNDQIDLVFWLSREYRCLWCGVGGVDEWIFKHNRETT